jgi:hypothetical protein
MILFNTRHKFNYLIISNFLEILSLLISIFI